MDPRLLPYYERELTYLRELGREFARDFPAVAGELGVSSGDPHVERLLEGFAFLAARVQLQIDAQFPRFTEQMLDLIYPDSVAPTPAMAVVALVPDPRQTLPAGGFTLPRGSLVSAELPDSRRSPCRFRTAHPLKLWPLEITSVSLRPFKGVAGQAAQLGGRSAEGELCIRIRALGGIRLAELEIEQLRLFLGHPDSVGRRLYDLCASGTRGVLYRTPQGEVFGKAGPDALTPAGFDDAEALLPCDQRSFHGHRVLEEYFALPSRFMFFDLAGVSAALRACPAEEAEICLLLEHHDRIVSSSLDTRHVRLFCAPVINLFQKRADRITLSEREHEYQVIPDRTREEDLEVHGISEVIGRGRRPEDDRRFVPFYSCSEGNRDVEGAYYTVHRRPRRRVQPARARASGYAGSDTFIALVEGAAGPFRESLQQLSVNTWCTNHDLPLALSEPAARPHLVLEEAAPVRSVELVAGPSPPLAARAWGDGAWQLIGHLACDHLPAPDQDDSARAQLRRLLELHSHGGNAAQQRQIQGIHSVTSQHVVRRLPEPGPACFARGLSLTVCCDERAFEGASLHLFGRVLASYFSRAAALNSFCELSLSGLSGTALQHYPAALAQRRAS